MIVEQLRLPPDPYLAPCQLHAETLALCPICLRMQGIDAVAIDTHGGFDGDALCPLCALADGLTALGAGLRAIGEAWERSVVWHGQRIGTLTPDGSGVVLYEATGATWDAYQRLCDACAEHTAGRLSDADLEAVAVDAASDVPLALLTGAIEPS